MTLRQRIKRVERLVRKHERKARAGCFANELAVYSFKSHLQDLKSQLKNQIS